MVITRDKNEGKNFNTKTHNESFESVEQVIYYATTLTNQNSIHEEL